MQLRNVIADLYAEKAKIERVIASLEELDVEDTLTAPAPKSRRGRKFMNPEERQEVSERMRRYWAARKAARRPEEQSIAVGAASAA
jgi:hypothetical protein